MSYAGKNDELFAWKCTSRCLRRDKVEHVGKERKWMERIKIVPLEDFERALILRQI